mgnify:CR=1
MDRSIVTKSTLQEENNHSTFYKDKTPLGRLNAACEIIYKEYKTNQFEKVDGTMFSAKKHNQIDLMPKEVKIYITDRNGTKHEVQGPTDMNMNIMELIRAYELAEEGTIGVCGGMAMCASCQCYVLNDVISLERNPDEEAMLWEAYHVKENSRLGCQIPITPEIDGLEIEIAPEQ